VLAGTLRVTELAGGPVVLPDADRFAAVPLPVVLHIVCASVYCVLGAFQFPARFRGRHRGWHRRAGRALVPLGITAALTGLWLTLFLEPPPGDGDLLAAFRIVAGTGMALSIVTGFLAILRRDIGQHRAWMIRGYAIGQGAGTQALIQVPLAALVGAPHGLSRTLLLGAGWAINVAVAELIIRKGLR